MRVAAAQLGPADVTRAGTVKRITALIAQAGGAGVKLLVLPELALSPYFAAAVHDIGPFVEPGFPSEETQPIADAVRQAGLVAVVPHAERAGDAVYNSSVVLGPDGAVAGRYRKSHIPGQLEPDQPGEFAILEKRYFAPGDLGFPLHDSPAGPFGIGICYDRRFPELYRCYALAGAALIACCFNTPARDGVSEAQEAQELATRGGAIANAVTVIAAGKAGVEGGVRYSGGSCVIDHKGRILAKAVTDGDELVAADLDLTAAAAARERMNLAANRRPELYRLLTAAAVAADTVSA